MLDVCVHVIDIANFFELKIVGDKQRKVTCATDLESQSSNGITWVKNRSFLKKVKQGVVLIQEGVPFTSDSAVTYLITQKAPKLIFSRILSRYFTPDDDFYLKNCVEKHLQNPEVKISENVFIGQNVVIGDGTVIYPNVVIEANSVIGSNCILHSNSSIGTAGLGFHFDETNSLLEKFPQLGNVILEDYVDLGPNSTIRRGALRETRVKRGTKVGAASVIGHNCEVGENCILAGGVIIGGSSRIGNNVFIGMHVAIRNGTEVGNNAEIGMGAVVLKNVFDHTTVYGNPAKERKEWEKK